MRADLRDGLNLSKQPLGVYLPRWLDETAGPTLAPSTLRGYRDALIHLEPIAAVPLNRLTAEDIERCLNGMRTHRFNAKAQQAASPKTAGNVLAMLRRALGQAEQRGHIRRNPAKLVPMRRASPPAIEALTPPRARAILDAVAGDRLEAAYALAFMGLRSSEILALPGPTSISRR